MRRTKEYFQGCLLGGAIGDALGWPVEFMRLPEIIRQYGSGGITDLVAGRKGLAEITDDTQMTIFTAEGLLRTQTRFSHKEICHPPSVVWRAYLRWLYTQGEQGNIDVDRSGWVIKVRELFVPRAPGRSCLSALESGEMGTIEKPINNSKGCGGVMRVAPVGLIANRDASFRLAAECAALTHGHPSGYLPAGVLAYIIACLVGGMELEDAVQESLKELQSYDGHEECLHALRKSIALSASGEEPLAAIGELGEGWTGEEALAISVYCALKFKDDYRRAVIAAVNHSGDSDSTGAITGNILGAYLGKGAIPGDWIAKVELRDVLTQLADDLLVTFQDTQDWRERYPGC